jgi:5-methyltetrahydropteroyltriglutamate--homocysteine methyltransferase
MVESCDVGSLPFVGDMNKFLEGANCYSSSTEDLRAQYFEEKIVESFLHKMQVGVLVPNYPQFRDMSNMFLSMIDGVEKVKGGYMETGPLSLQSGKGILPEVGAIIKHSQEFYEKLGDSFKVRICITGPYTLASQFLYKDKRIFSRLGNILAQIVESNVFSNKYGSVSLVALDEPVFGLVDDPSMDRGSEARENLHGAWELILEKAKSKNVQACLHIHSTRDELFWQIKSLDIIEVPMNDPMYKARRTKQLLESTDKFLNASITAADFDQLIRNYLVANSQQKMSEMTINEKIGETWKEIKEGKVNPLIFLESTDLMQKRLTRLIENFGAHRVSYSVPECGLRGFPTYECALECLRRVADATKAATAQ